MAAYLVYANQDAVFDLCQAVRDSSPADHLLAALEKLLIHRPWTSRTGSWVDQNLRLSYDAGAQGGIVARSDVKSEVFT